MIHEAWIQAARQNFRRMVLSGNMPQALAFVQEALQHPRALDPRTEGPVASEMAHEFAVAVGALNLGRPHSWDDSGTLLELGQAYLRLNMPSIAATILLRAHELEPRDKQIASAATLALLDIGDPHRAKNVVMEAELFLSRDAVEWYLSAFTALTTADLGLVDELLESPPAVSTRSGSHLLIRMQHMYARAQLLIANGGLDTSDLRGWHYVLTAGMLLARSPYGSHMNGRYGYLHDTAARCRSSIDRLTKVFERLNVEVPRIIAADDIDSLILGNATARIMSLPLITMSTADSDTKGLLIVYKLDNQSAEIAGRLRKHNVGQPLWVHSGGWTHEESVAGDLTTSLVQFCRPEWMGSSAHGRPDLEKWVQCIIDHEVSDDNGPDFDDLLQLMGVITENLTDQAVAPAVLQNQGQRLRQWAASPVPSARFV